MIKCINCGYFLNCNKASEEIRECEEFIKSKRIIERSTKDELSKRINKESL